MVVLNKEYDSGWLQGGLLQVLFFYINSKILFK